MPPGGINFYVVRLLRRTVLSKPRTISPLNSIDDPSPQTNVLSIEESNNMRPTKACVQCRSGKRRCDGVKNAACIQCARRHLPCSAAVSTTGHSPGAGAGADGNFHVSHQTGLDDNASSLVDLYFRRIDQKPHSLFHEPTFRASIAARTASRTVLVSMIAMCARYV